MKINKLNIVLIFKRKTLLPSDHYYFSPLSDDGIPLPLMELFRSPFPSAVFSKNKNKCLRYRYIITTWLAKESGSKIHIV